MWPDWVGSVDSENNGKQKMNKFNTYIKLSIDLLDIKFDLYKEIKCNV